MCGKAYNSRRVGHSAFAIDTIYTGKGDFCIQKTVIFKCFCPFLLSKLHQVSLVLMTLDFQCQSKGQGVFFGVPKGG